MDSNSPSPQEIRKWLKKWGFPKRHIERLGHMEGPSLEEAKSRTGSILTGDCLLLVCGDRGPGKTQMAAYWGRETALWKKRAEYYKAHDFLCLIREQFDKDPQRSTVAREAMERARKCHLLIIDEWSELAGTEWEMRTMTSLIDHRYDNLLSTVIITNHTPKEAVEAVGESIWSRAEETGGIVVCYWESYRKKS